MRKVYPFLLLSLAFLVTQGSSEGQISLYHWPPGTSLPTGPCFIGDIFVKTDAASGQKAYVATGTNPCAWEVQGGGGSAHIIKEEGGTGLTQRTNLNFIGTTVTATDNAGTDSTDITITGGGGGATTALDNLVSVAINTALLPNVAAAFDFGSALLPFKDIFFAGASGTPGTNNFKLTGTSTSGTRTITAADGNSVTVVPEAGSANNFLTAISTAGAIFKAQPSCSSLSNGATGCSTTVGTAATHADTDFEVPLTFGAGVVRSTNTISTASGEADFLASGALTCGAGTQGKAQVHTTPLQYCDNAANPTLRYTAYANSAGKATSAATADTATNGVIAVSPGAGIAHFAGATQTVTSSAVVDADISSTIGVAHGGTALATLTAHALYAGNGTSAPTALAVGATNTVLLGNTGADPSFGAVSSGHLAAANKTLSKDIHIKSPVTGDSNMVQIYWPATVTITRVACSIDTGTSVTINFDERAEATPNTAGTNTLSADLVCDTNSQTSCSSGCDVNTISDSGIAIRVPHNLQITGVSGTVNVLRVHLEATIN